MPASIEIVIDISREEYPLFQQNLPHHPRLPLGYESWLMSEARSENALRSTGIKTQRVAIPFYNFADHLERTGAPPNYAVLHSYAKTVAGYEKQFGRDER